MITFQVIPQPLQETYAIIFWNRFYFLREIHGKIEWKVQSSYAPLPPLTHSFPHQQYPVRSSAFVTTQGPTLTCQCDLESIACTGFTCGGVHSMSFNRY